MILLLCIAILAVATYLIAGTAGSLRGRRFRGAWWFAFAVSLLAGASFGVWSTLVRAQEWQIISTMRFVGFPLPATILVNEEGVWTDFVRSKALTYTIVFVDVAADASLALLPLRLVAALTMSPRKTRRPLIHGG